MSKALEIKNLQIYYNNIHAVKGIHLKIPKGSIVAILGSNGAGKSTTLKSISGLKEIDSGEILLDGKKIHHLTPAKINKEGVIQAPEGRQIFPDLTVEENLAIGGFTVKSKKEIKNNYEQVFNYFPILKERKKQMAGTLSGGEQQMLAIGRALMASPEVLLLDEPSLGLAPLIVKDIFKIVEEINAAGTTVLIVEQNALQTLKISDYAYVLEVGEVLIEGPANELIQNKKLIEAYLGGSSSSNVDENLS